MLTALTQVSGTDRKIQFAAGKEEFFFLLSTLFMSTSSTIVCWNLRGVRPTAFMCSNSTSAFMSSVDYMWRVIFTTLCHVTDLTRNSKIENTVRLKEFVVSSFCV